MTTQSLASAENWAMCNPHDLFLERAATVEPGGERAFIEAQIDAFRDRAHWLEREARCWHGYIAPIRKGKRADRVDTGSVADFVGERAAAYRAYAQALEGALALLDP